MSITTRVAEPVGRRSSRTRTTPEIVLFSSLYALAVVLFPWELISRAGFPDFASYVDDFNSRTISKLELYELSGLSQYFTFELLWHELIIRLTSLTEDASIALRLISFFILFVWAFFLFRRVRYAVAILFLLNPTALDVALSGIRNGLAWSLFIIGISVQSKLLRGVLFVIAMFIHSSTLVLVFLFYFAVWARRTFKGRSLLLSGLAGGILTGLALTIGSQLLLSAIGDRRLELSYVVGGGSFLQASIWGILLWLQCISGRTYVRENIFVISIVVWYEMMNPFIPWSFRIWGALLPVIAASALTLPVRKRQLFLYTYSGYLVLQYVYWTKLLNYWVSA